MHGIPDLVINPGNGYAGILTATQLFKFFITKSPDPFALAYPDARILRYF
jgi:hypothetical protein